jgi:GxxExxY protein
MNSDTVEERQGSANRDDLDKVATQIVDAGFKVHVTLGPGLLESAYENCFAYELAERGFNVRRQVPVAISYGRLKIDAAYRIDLLVDEKIIVEVKAADALTPTHHAQLLTYLKLSGLRLGFLINFNAPLFKQGIKRLAR